MSNCNCGCNRICVTLAIFASIIIGFIAAILSVTATITVTPAFLWVAGGIAIVYLALLLLISPHITGIVRGCVCNVLPALFAGILGTLLTSVILLAVSFAATSVAGAVITGALLLFLSLLIITTVCLIRCITGCSEE